MMHPSLSKLARHVKSFHRTLIHHPNCLSSSRLHGRCCSSGGGIFHKMDRGEASSQHSNSGTEKVFLVKHNMPFWSAQRDNNRQRQIIRLPHIQGFLPSDGGRSTFRVSISPSVQRSSGKSKCNDIHNHKEDTRESAKRQMGMRIAESCMEPQHFCLQSDEIHPFQLLYGEGPVTPEDIKFHSTRTRMEATYSPNEAKSKNLLEPECMKALENL
jgi:hypothetical protein